jgi:starvation-inducible DNA-binding protein
MRTVPLCILNLVFTLANVPTAPDSASADFKQECPDMIHAQSHAAKMARTRSLDLLNQHLAAAVILHDRMRQSPRHLRGADFIMVDDLCSRIADLMDICAAEITGRLADLGGTPQYPVQLGRYLPAIVSILPDPVRAVDWPAEDTGPIDVFAQSVLDAAAVAEVYGDAATADFLAQIWCDDDPQGWTTIKITTAAH